jgi:hypothetical protein
VLTIVKNRSSPPSSSVVAFSNEDDLLGNDWMSSIELTEGQSSPALQKARMAASARKVDWRDIKLLLMHRPTLRTMYNIGCMTHPGFVGSFN